MAKLWDELEKRAIFASDPGHAGRPGERGGSAPGKGVDLPYLKNTKLVIDNDNASLANKLLGQLPSRYPSLAALLENKPLKEIKFGKIESSDFRAMMATGVYDPNKQSLTVTGGVPARDPSPRFPNARPFQYGGDNPDPVERINADMLHEMAHHIDHLYVSESPALRKELAALWKDSKAANKGYNDWYTQSNKQPAVSGYATARKSEYFAESLTAYLLNKDDLERRDPKMSVFLDKLVKDATKNQ